jgi:hypothetical protein
VSVILLEASESTRFIYGQLHVPKWCKHIDLALHDIPDALPLIMLKTVYTFLFKQVILYSLGIKIDIS